MVVNIEGLVSGGRGIAHQNGKTIFVKNALPGESVDIVIDREKKGFAEASVISYDRVSSDRITPVCPYFGLCGGCDFLYVSEKRSAELKQEIVKDNLRRIAKIGSLPEFLPPAYSSFDGYRSRCRVHVDLKSKRQGFLAQGSNDLIDIPSCLALDENLNGYISERGGKLFKIARSLMFENKVNKTSGFVEVPLFSGDNDVSTGRDAVSVTVNDTLYKVSANVFFQSNLKVLPKLFEFVVSNTIGENVMDLYSGVGTFSALFEGSGRNVYAVERQKECLSLSRENAPSAISYTSDVASWAKKSKVSVDTVIVDPPRVGLENGVAEMIYSWKPKRIIYISCNSVTASRDIPLFNEYGLAKAQIFDFYPGSGHEESGFILERL